MNLPVIRMELFPIHTVEQEHKGPDELPAGVMQHSDARLIDRSPIRNQIRVHYIPHNGCVAERGGGGEREISKSN